MSWFEVDREGLAKLIERRGKAFLLYELIQNAWDTETGSVHVTIEPYDNKPQVRLVVEDEDPNGFADLSHAYTLFAESVKKGDPTKRGRFNLGEKLVLALCNEAEISSTKGTVVFHKDGRRHTTRHKRESGSQFWAKVRMTRKEMHDVIEALHLLIPPALITTTINNTELPVRSPVGEFRTGLQTVISDDEGNLKRTTRQTDVEVYEPEPGEVGTIYEMGIPVVETGDRWHVNVLQKVPVNMDRDNVPPSYLRTLRAHTLNAMHQRLTTDDAVQQWVGDALEHPEVDEQAVSDALTARYGENKAIYDPSDPEANNKLASEGYTLIHGGAFSRDAWENIKRTEAAVPAGKIRPTPKPYSDDPSAPQVKLVPESEWSPGMHQVVALAKRLGDELLGRHDLQVRIVDTSNAFAAAYGRGCLDLNLRSLGRSWFHLWQSHLDQVLDVLLHEFAHEYESNHLSEAYYNAISKLGGELAFLALRAPSVFDADTSLPGGES